MWLMQRVQNAIDKAESRNELIGMRRAAYEAAQWERKLPYQGASNLHIPIIGIVVDFVHERICEALYGQTPYITVKPQARQNQISAEEARALEELLWHFDELTEARTTESLTIRDSLIAGFGVTQVVQQQEYRTINTPGASHDVEVFNGPVELYIPPEEMVFYPNQLDDIEDAQIAGHRTIARFSDLLGGTSTAYYNRDWVEELRNGGTLPLEAGDDDERHGIEPTDPVTWRDEFYDLVDGICTYDLDGDEVEEDYCFCIDVTTWTLIRFMRMPYALAQKYYNIVTPLPDGSIYGYSLAGRLMDLDQEASVLHNQSVDNGTIANIPWMSVLESSPAAKQITDIYPGARIIVSDHDEIKERQFGQPGMALAEAQASVFEFAKMVGGVSEMGLGNTRGQTAYGVEQGASQSSMKLRMMVAECSKWKRKIAWQKLAIMKQLLPKDDFSRITNLPNFLVSMTWADFFQQIVVSPRANSTVTNPEMERMKWVFIREASKMDPLIAQDPGRWWEIDKRFFLAHGIDDYEPIIGPKPPSAEATAGQQMAPQQESRQEQKLQQAPVPQQLEMAAGGG